MTETENPELQRSQEEELQEQREFLIALVRDNQILYDTYCPANRNALLKKKAWAEVAAQHGNSVLWCKTEWKKLREAYLKKKKIILGKTGNAKKRIEAWTHFSSLRFLDEFLVIRPKSSGTADANEAMSYDDINYKEENGVDEERSYEPEPSSSKCIASYSAIRPQKHPLEKLEEDTMDYYMKRHKETPDEHYYFGMAMAEKMRRMDPAASSFAKIRISQLMHEIEFPDSLHKYNHAL